MLHLSNWMQSRLLLDLFYFYLHEFKSQDWSTCAYSKERVLFCFVLFCFGGNKSSHFGDKKIPSANWRKGFFVLGGNTQKWPYFQEIKLEVAIFRQWVPVGRQNYAEKNITVLSSVLFRIFFWFVAKSPIIHRKMQKKWWSSLGRFSQIWRFLVPPPPSLLKIIKTSPNHFSFQVLIFYFTFWRIFTSVKNTLGLLSDL